MQGYWENDEVRALFKQVEECKERGEKIKQAFICHAEKFARKENSVRNYYYYELKDESRLKMLGIDIKKHAKNKIATFSEEEERALIERLQQMTKNGMSVRKACLLLADGDALKLLRYQNKYRNFLAKERNKQQSKKENIIVFKKPSGALSDSEVQSLFMGLVRLVKRNACIEGEERAKQKIENANQKLKKALLQLQVQAREIDKMKERYEQLKQKSNQLATALLVSRCDKAGKLRAKFNATATEKEKIKKGS